MALVTQPLTIRLHTPERLKESYDLLAATHAELVSINLNNSPMQWHTKKRLEAQIDAVLAFFQELLPPNMREG